jgi:GWxTD domain-containing protein
MNRHLVISVVLFLTVFLNAEADDFPFNSDYSVFREESSNVFVEFYYSFDPRQLVFIRSGTGFEASGRIELEILRKSDSKLIAKDFKIPMQLADTSGANKDIKLTGQINMILESGDYNMKVKASDFNDSKKSWVSEQAVTLTSYPAGKVSISSIQLSTDIVKSSDVNSIFYKNTLEVTPNPSALFGNNISKLFYYAEIYGIGKEEIGDKYSVSVTVEDNSGKELKNSAKNFDVKTESKVEYGSFDISELPSDKYTLIIKILDSKVKEVTRVSKVFYVYNSSVVVPQTDLGDFEKEYMMSEYPGLGDEQVQNEFDRAIYLMSYIQKNQYTSLKEPDARKMYMYKFWKGIERVITKKEYFSRVDIANKLYKDDLRDGWKTDRGRVYCLYGKPDDVERFPYQASTRAYEIWNYNVLQGGVEFVFIDMSAGYGDFIMVHSTAQNEIDDRFWRDKLSVK